MDHRVDGPMLPWRRCSVFCGSATAPFHRLQRTTFHSFGHLRPKNLCYDRFFDPGGMSPLAPGLGRESAEGGSKKRERHGGEQVFRKRRDADGMLSEGEEIVAVCRQLEVAVCPAEYP